MFGLWYSVKVKFWLNALHASTKLVEWINARAEKSLGIINSGMLVTNPQGKIIAGMVKSDDVVTVFGPN